MNFGLSAMIILVLSIQKGTSLECYECTTLLNEDECGEDFDSDGLFTKTCDDGEVCMIHLTPEVMDFPEIIQRDCTDPYYCTKEDEFTEHCILCDEDLCNFSSRIAPNCILVVIYLTIKSFL